MSFSDGDDCQDPSSSPEPQESTPSPPGPTPADSLPLSPGSSTEGAQEYISDDEGDQSDVGGDSGEDSNVSLGTAEVDMNLSDGAKLMSDSLSDNDSSEEDLSDYSSENLEHFQSRSIESAGGCGVPLYPDSCITDDGFNTIFLSLVQRHNLTYTSQCDILKFFSILLPSPSRVPSSSRVLISKYINFKEDAIVRYFCGFCMHPIESGSSCDQQQCIRAQLPRAVFVRIPLRMQVRERFEGNVCNTVDWVVTRKTTCIC